MLTFYDAFHGIGGFRRGLEEAGMKCVGGCEIDKFACQAYGVVNHEECSPTDIRAVDPVRLPDFDVFVGGFPCQAFSIAGKRRGFQDTRGTLFFEICRICSVKRPGLILLENVEDLLNHDEGRTFEVILQSLDELGYDAEWQVHNSAAYLPQNRERVFIVGHLRGRGTREIFPFGRENENSVRVIGRININADDYCKRVYSTEGLSPCLPTMQGGSQEPKVLVVGNTNPSGNGMNGQVYDSIGLSPTLTTNKGEGNKILIRPVIDPGRPNKTMNGRQIKEPGEPMFTLTTQDRHGIYDGSRIRKLTPLECFRLQGYPDEWFRICDEAGISDSQLYKMAGNGVSVPVVREIGKRLVQSFIVSTEST